MSRFLACLATLAASSLLVPGCLLVVDASGDGETVIVDDYAFDEPVTAIETDVDSGRIEVLPANGDRTEVAVEITYEGDTPAYDVRVTDGLLRIDLDCPVLALTCEGVFVIRMPVAAHASLGLGAGDVVVDERAGNVEIDLDAGAVGCAGLTSERARVTLGTGDVELAFRADASPASLSVDIGVGDADLSVPRGAYDIDASSAIGAVTLDGVDHTAGAPRTIHAATGAGSVFIRGL